MSKITKTAQIYKFLFFSAALVLLVAGKNWILAFAKENHSSTPKTASQEITTQTATQTNTTEQSTSQIQTSAAQPAAVVQTAPAAKHSVTRTSDDDDRPRQSINRDDD